MTIVNLHAYARGKLAALVDEHLSIQEGIPNFPPRAMDEDLRRLDEIGIELAAIAMRVRPHARFHCSDCGRQLTLDNAAGNIGFGILCRQCAARDGG